MSLRVLILPRHASQAASCRHRFLQYLPYLREHGFTCDVSPFFDERYTAAVLDEGRKQWWRFGQSAVSRVRALLRARRYDLVVVHAEFVPFLPHVLEHWLGRLAVPFVVDFDDAFFHAYDQHRSALVRGTLGTKIGRLMAEAALNCPGSDYLAAYARRFSSRVSVVPTVVDLSRYPAAPTTPDPETFSIGWIGSPATTPHLQSVMGELVAFARGRNVRIVAIGARPFEVGDAPVQWLEWREDSEVSELARTHVGIMPLPSSMWAEGKCGFKLIQAMACWRPVVASPVGANTRIVTHGVSGLHARPGEWGSALARLYDDPSLCERMGAAGRTTIAREYSLDVWAPRLAALWSAAAGRAHAWPAVVPAGSQPCAE
ncbi:MAG TPA: glycosyltransferase family 4 protein [Vicinamibacterales bacterium]|nr:glycosyltransferase family 4 protein [Vicinamibacterales bacterium]